MVKGLFVPFPLGISRTGGAFDIEKLEGYSLPILYVGLI
jgi:hypothetical protein